MFGVRYENKSFYNEKNVMGHAQKYYLISMYNMEKYLS